MVGKCKNNHFFTRVARDSQKGDCPLFGKTITRKSRLPQMRDLEVRQATPDIPCP